MTEMAALKQTEIFEAENESLAFLAQIFWEFQQKLFGLVLKSNTEIHDVAREKFAFYANMEKFGMSVTGTIEQVYMLYELSYIFGDNFFRYSEIGIHCRHAKLWKSETVGQNSCCRESLAFDNNEDACTVQEPLQLSVRPGWRQQGGDFGEAEPACCSNLARNVLTGVFSSHILQIKIEINGLFVSKGVDAQFLMPVNNSDRTGFQLQMINGENETLNDGSVQLPENE